MKKLVVKSESEEEDQKALHIIQKRPDDIDEVVWYSHLGKRLARIDELSKRIDAVDNRIEGLSEDICRTRTNLCNLDRFVSELYAKIEKDEERLHFLETTKKQRKEPGAQADDSKTKK